MLSKQRMEATTATQMEFADDQPGKFTGYASVFNGIDAAGDTILPGAYKSVIQAGVLPKMYWNHSHRDLPLGRYTAWREDDVGLLMEGQINLKTTFGRDVYESLRHGDIDGLSVFIGWNSDEDEIRQPDKSRRVIKNIRAVPEVSICSVPVDNAARVDLASVKSAIDACTTLAELEDFLRDAGGLSRSTAKAFMAKFRTVTLRDAADPKGTGAIVDLSCLNATESLKTYFNWS